MAHQRLDGGEGFQAPHSDGAILRTCSGCMGQAWDIPTETQGFLWICLAHKMGFNMFYYALSLQKCGFNIFQLVQNKDLIGIKDM